MNLRNKSVVDCNSVLHVELTSKKQRNEAAALNEVVNRQKHRGFYDLEHIAAKLKTTVARTFSLSNRNMVRRIKSTYVLICS